MTTTDPRIGQQLGAYKILDLIGEGGMGAVYRALHPTLDRYAAIKFLQTARGADSSQAREARDQRFVREARAIARLRHPHVVQLYDFGTCEDGYYMVLEFIEGESLQARLARTHAAGERLPHPQVQQIIDQVTDALDHVHQEGIVHRDIKPANILLTAEGEAILTDFGIARVLTEAGQTTTGVALGTPFYIAPEQAKGMDVDHRADLYALGVVLYEMLAGRPPFVADNAMALLVQHLQEPVPPLQQFAPDVPPAVARELVKALCKLPEYRHQSAAAFRLAFRQAWQAPAGSPWATQMSDGQTLIQPSAPAAPQAPVTRAPTTDTLPAWQGELVDRHAEIQALKQRLAAAPTLISLVGMGGLGKTALALSIAHEMTTDDTFPDGVLWIDGREHTTLGAILVELADLLDLDLGQGTLSQQRRAVRFRLADRKALVIMDNLETVEDAQDVARFLQALPCAVLVTGRTRPPGAEVIELTPLPAEDAVQLFQATSGMTAEQVDEDTADLCALDLEGHPLAIEVVGALAAAGLDTAELRAYLREMPLDVLGETAAEAGRSVVDALQLSYQRLSPLAQTMLARISIFPTDFDLASLAVLSPEHSRLHQVKGLRELMDRSLLTQVARQRYRLHPVTRQFAYALLDDPTPYHRRAGAYFLTEAGADTLAATEQYFLAGDVAQAAALVPDHVEAWINAGRASRALQQVNRFEAADLGPETWQALCESRGDLHALLGETDAALAAYHEAVAEAQSPESLARVKHKIGELVRRQQPAEALVWFEEALAHLDDPESLDAARTYISIGAAYGLQGTYEEASAYLQKGLRIAQQRDASFEIARAKINLGNLYAVQGAYAQAIAVYQKALTLLQEEARHYPLIESTLQANLASLYVDQGDWQQAIAYYEQTLRTQEQLGDVDGIARTCFNLGDVYVFRGAYERAEENLQRCLKLWTQAEADYGVAATHMNLGLLHLRRGAYREAGEALSRSQAMFETMESDDYLPTILQLLGEVALAQGQPAEAVTYAQRSLALAQAMGARMEEGVARRVVGLGLAAQGHKEAALETLHRSLNVLDELGHLYEIARTRYALGRVYLDEDQAQAVAHLRAALETFTHLGAAPDVALTESALARVEGEYED
jgi:tetratricopeptide (TPR) repeat protein/tRNA A-37 threonylcarbamoyl transferase component Bud32